jgi:hypothetical protein
MSEYPENHIVEIIAPDGMPLHIKGLFYRGTLQWFSFSFIGPDGKTHPCVMPEDGDDPMAQKIQELLHVTFVKSEKLNRKSNSNKRC